MKNKIYVFIKREYEDIFEVKTFKTKKEALDYSYNDTINTINHLTDDYLSCGHNISPTEMRDKMINNLKEQYQKENLNYFDIWETELN